MPTLKVTTVVHFEDIAGLEHYVKDHAGFDFDDKLALLKNRRVVIPSSEDENDTQTIEILEEDE